MLVCPDCLLWVSLGTATAWPSFGEICGRVHRAFSLGELARRFSHCVFCLGVDEDGKRYYEPICDFSLVEAINVILHFNGSHFEVSKVQEEHPPHPVSSETHRASSSSRPASTLRIPLQWHWPSLFVGASPQGFHDYHNPFAHQPSWPRLQSRSVRWALRTSHTSLKLPPFQIWPQQRTVANRLLE